MVLGNDGNLYYSDSSGKSIRRMSPTGVCSTLYTDSNLYYYPNNLYVLNDGSIIFHDCITTFYKVTMSGSK
jgi:hypothetical protein